ncbi:MAG: diguanylate cyclase [Rubrivivax sp.]
MSPAAAAPSRSRVGLPLGLLALLLVAASILLAAGIGYLLAAAIGLREPWVAAAAAAAGMTLAALPIGALLYGLARAFERGTPAAQAPAEPGPAMAPSRFMELAEREWARARRYGSGAALLVVEIDRFARLAERHGPAAVEAMRAALARDIAPTLRAADALTEHGEGRLAVFLAHADALGSLDVAERIREHAERLAVAPDGETLRVSVGVAHLRPAHLHLQALVEDAGDAVAAARQAGGNCVRAAPVEVSRFSAPRRDDQRAPKR